jgi:hypothetical protein
MALSRHFRQRPLYRTSARGLASCLAGSRAQDDCTGTAPRKLPVRPPASTSAAGRRRGARGRAGASVRSAQMLRLTAPALSRLHEAIAIGLGFRGLDLSDTLSFDRGGHRPSLEQALLSGDVRGDVMPTAADVAIARVPRSRHTPSVVLRRRPTRHASSPSASSAASPALLNEPNLSTAHSSAVLPSCAAELADTIRPPRTRISGCRRSVGLPADTRATRRDGLVRTGGGSEPGTAWAPR